MKRTAYILKRTNQLVGSKKLPSNGQYRFSQESGLTTNKQELAAIQPAFCFFNESKKTMIDFKTNNGPVSEPSSKTIYPIQHAKSFEAFQNNLKLNLQIVRNKLFVYNLSTVKK